MMCALGDQESQNISFGYVHTSSRFLYTGTFICKLFSINSLKMMIRTSDIRTAVNHIIFSTYNKTINIHKLNYEYTPGVYMYFF